MLRYLNKKNHKTLTDVSQTCEATRFRLPDTACMATAQHAWTSLSLPLIVMIVCVELPGHYEW